MFHPEQLPHSCLPVAPLPLLPGLFAESETLRLRMAYQQDATLLLGSNFNSSAVVPSGRRRLLAEPAISGANSTTVVSGKP